MKLLYQYFKKRYYNKGKYFRKKYSKKLEYYLFLNTKPETQSKNLLRLNPNDSEIDMVTIAFNNALIIEHQINLLTKISQINSHISLRIILMILMQENQ
jgi:hypothetical protein